MGTCSDSAILPINGMNKARLAKLSLLIFLLVSILFFVVGLMDIIRTRENEGSPLFTAVATRNEGWVRRSVSIPGAIKKTPLGSRLKSQENALGVHALGLTSKKSIFTDPDIRLNLQAWHDRSVC
jgi:hypothetical protein